MVLTRREFSAALLPGTLLSAVGQRWNILWISSEDTSPDLGCYGDPYARTPNLDRLASQGARCANAFTVAGVCAPSRSGIITAMYPTSIGTHHMRSKGVPPSYVKCFPEYLRAAGYYCSNNSKTDYNFDPPVTAWDESSPRAHWRNREKGQPFFSVFNITSSHESRIWDENYPAIARQLTPEELHDPAKAVLPPYYPDTPVVRRAWANYYDCVTLMDKQAGEILRELERDGLSDSTVVFYWGDHGRGLTRAKRWIYDSGIHIPLLVRWPGVLRPGAVIDDLVSGIDFGPTVLSIAGVKIPGYMQGQAFLGQQAAPPRQYIYAARDRMDETYDIIRSVRDKRFKYIRNYKPGRPYAQHIITAERSQVLQEWRRLNKARELKGPQKIFFLPEKPEEELYDIVADPHEVNNLAGRPEYREALQRLRRVHEQWMKDTGDLGLIPEEELDERMRPGGKWSATAAPIINPSGGRFAGPVQVRISCPTEGASIAYTTESGDKPRWKLYSHEIALNTSARLRALACRLGYKDSPEAVAEFQIG
jgi:N-sulfoglucosamine sulfohydrolase